MNANAQLKRVRAYRQHVALMLQATTSQLLDNIRLDPARILTDAGFDPDFWQADLLRKEYERILLLCSRQIGKSLTAAALALRTALLEPDSLTLILAPTLRQAGEMFRDKVMRLYGRLGRPMATVQESALTMQLENGSRIISLPGDEKTVQGYSAARLLIIDEASRVSDELYHFVRPMLATSAGRLICLTTPHGMQGFFYSEWISNNPWKKVRITADQCSRIPPAFLEEERLSKGDRYYRQEYMCSFEAAVGALFSEELIAGIFARPVETLDL